MSYKTIPDLDDGFGDLEPQHAEDTDFLVKIRIPESMQRFQNKTIIGPVLQVHIIRYLGISGIEIQIPSTTTKE